DLLAIHRDLLHSLLNAILIPNNDGEIFLPEFSRDLYFFPIRGNAWINPQAPILRLDSENVSRRSIIRPRCAAAQPGKPRCTIPRTVLAVGELAIDIRFDLSDFGFRIVGRGHELPVILIRLVPSPQYRFSDDC